MRASVLPLAALLVAGLGLGCGRDIDPPRSDRATIPAETFTRVVEALSAARAETLPDTAAMRRRRAEILERHDVTAADLLRFVEVHGADDERMAPIYRRVGTRLDSLMQERARDGSAPDRFPTPPRVAPAPEAAAPEAAPDTTASETTDPDAAVPEASPAPGDTTR